MNKKVFCVGYPNIAGKICSTCGNFIPPSMEIKMIADNKNKKKIIEHKVRQAIRRKFGLDGEKDANIRH